MDVQDLLQLVERPEAHACAECRAPICGHVVLLSTAAGFKDRSLCLLCLAVGLEQPLAEVRDQAFTYVMHKDCYGEAWRVVSAREESRDPERPDCVFSVPESGVESRPSSRGQPTVAAEAPIARYDAGDLGCGDLVLELRHRLSELTAGSLIQVRATDPGAPEDLPAWCRMTGHRLVDARHPLYLIRRKEK